jgi:hypothetical protein
MDLDGYPHPFLLMTYLFVPPFHQGYTLPYLIAIHSEGRGRDIREA